MNTDKIYAESIANEYAMKDEKKVVALKKLDKKAKRPSNIFAYTFGIISALVLGVGMCLSMKVIGGGYTSPRKRNFGRRIIFYEYLRLIQTLQNR